MLHRRIGWGVLPELDIAEAGFDHELHEVELGVETEKFGGFIEAHIQYVGDAFAVPASSSSSAP